MAYDRNDGGGAMYHRLTMEGREKLTVAGVEDVERFDEIGRASCRERV